MNIKVTKNKVSIEEIDPIHSGEYKVNQCTFEFSDTYTVGLIKKAIFTTNNDSNSYEVAIENDTCDIPVEVLKKDGVIEIGVYAYEEENDELVLRYSPTPTRVRVIEGSYKNADEGTTFIHADEVVTKEELNNNLSHYYTKEEIDNMIGAIRGDN